MKRGGQSREGRRTRRHPACSHLIGGVQEAPADTAPIVPDVPEPQAIEVPDYTGMTLLVVKADAEASGWSVVVTYAFSSEPAGTVLNQFPYAGSQLEPGATVKLRVAKERPQQKKAAPARQNCHPSYTGACLRPDASDYDCAGGSGNGPYYVDGPVYVHGSDPYDLDRDGDGVGCE